MKLLGLDLGLHLEQLELILGMEPGLDLEMKPVKLLGVLP